MENIEQDKLLDEAVEQLKNRPVDTEPLERLSAQMLRYTKEHNGRRHHIHNPLGEIFRYAAVAAICCGILWLYLSSDGTNSNLAWGDVVKKVSSIDCVHIYQYDYYNGELASSRQGWGWYGGGKLCFIDENGVITVDDGQNKRYYTADGVLKSEKESEFGQIDQYVSGGNDIFDMLVKGVFGYDESQVSQVRPAEVGEDFLVYKFDSPRKPVDYLDSVSVLVGKGSGLPVQARVAANIGVNSYSLIIFDYQSSLIPQNIKEIMGYNEEIEREMSSEK